MAESPVQGTRAPRSAACTGHISKGIWWRKPLAGGRLFSFILMLKLTMRNYLTETLAIAELIFLLPTLIVGIVFNLFKHFVLGKKVDEREKGFKGIYYLFSFIIWLAIGSWLIYQSQFTNITYVYACPSNSNSKCYKVRADYISEDCEDTEWDTRGVSGGRCTDPYIEKIYFNNGGYITFEYCEMKNKGKWNCYAENGDDGTWNLQIAEIVKVKK